MFVRALAMLALLILLILLCSPGTASAGPAGTLDRLVADLDVRLGEALGERDLSELDMGLAVRALGGTPDRLGEVVSQLLLARLRARAPRSVSLAARDLDKAAQQAWTDTQGLELLLEVDVTLGTGHLHLVGVLRECDRHLWRDILTPRRGALNHLHASTRMDAEVRAYQGALSSGSLRLSAETSPVPMDGAILALSSGDLDGDGRAELLVLQPRALLVLKYKGPRRGFTLAYQVPLSGAPAPTRPRRAMGTLLALDRDGDRKPEVLLRSSEMAQGEELALTDGALASRGHLEGYPLAVTDGALLTCPARPGQDLLDGAVAVWRTRDKEPAPVTGLPTSFYTLKQARATSAQGPTPVFQAVVDGSGTLRLKDMAATPAAAELSLKGVGVALHLVDLTDDGSLEVITTGGGDPGVEDLLRIHRIKQGKLTGPLWSSAGLPGAITALSHGDLDGDGKLELVAALAIRAGVAQLMVLR